MENRWNKKKKGSTAFLYSVTYNLLRWKGFKRGGEGTVRSASVNFHNLWICIFEFLILDDDTFRPTLFLGNKVLMVLGIQSISNLSKPVSILFYFNKLCTSNLNNLIKIVAIKIFCRPKVFNICKKYLA